MIIIKWFEPFLRDEPFDINQLSQKSHQKNSFWNVNTTGNLVEDLPNFDSLSPRLIEKIKGT